MAIRQDKFTSIDRKKNLISYYSPDAKISEQFRLIRTNIYFLSKVQPVRTLLITSPNEGDGKSTTAANLAVSMTLQNAKVLLIDANLRKPTVHLTFNIDNNIGLTSVLGEINSLEDAIHKTEIGKLDILPSGPVSPFPSELLASNNFNRLLVNTQELYDYVLIDSPSIFGSVDTKVLASQCNGVILVAKRKTGLKQMLEVKKDFELSNSNILGIVLNK